MRDLSQITVLCDTKSLKECSSTWSRDTKLTVGCWTAPASAGVRYHPHVAYIYPGKLLSKIFFTNYKLHTFPSGLLFSTQISSVVLTAGAVGVAEAVGGIPGGKIKPGGGGMLPTGGGINGGLLEGRKTIHCNIFQFWPLQPTIHEKVYSTFPLCHTTVTVPTECVRLICLCLYFSHRLHSTFLTVLIQLLNLSYIEV